MVEVTGLEPTTSWSLTKRATKLRYTSIFLLYIFGSFHDLFFSTALGYRCLRSRSHPARLVRLAQTIFNCLQNAILTPNQARYQTALHLNESIFYYIDNSKTVKQFYPINYKIFRMICQTIILFQNRLPKHKPLPAKKKPKKAFRFLA